MNLSGLEDLIKELKKQENNCDVQLDKIVTYKDYGIGKEGIIIYYWNKNRFKNKIEKTNDIIE
jgi:hypothetical protein